MTDGPQVRVLARTRGQGSTARIIQSLARQARRGAHRPVPSWLGDAC